MTHHDEKDERDRAKAEDQSDGVKDAPEEPAGDSASNPEKEDTPDAKE